MYICLTQTGSSSSASQNGSPSDNNSVEQDVRSFADDQDDSEKRRQLKGKSVMIYDSKKKSPPIFNVGQISYIEKKRETETGGCVKKI